MLSEGFDAGSRAQVPVYYLVRPTESGSIKQECFQEVKAIAQVMPFTAAVPSVEH